MAFSPDWVECKKEWAVRAGKASTTPSAGNYQQLS